VRGLDVSIIAGLALSLIVAAISPAVTADEVGATAEPSVEKSGRPNFVIILADDLGYTDIAPFGSEINTPTLTALAKRGVSFTNYHTAANCAPARAMLLTGVNNHRAGVANIPETVPLAHRRSPQYQGVLGDNVVTVATLLEDAGYHTYMSGKWHLGHEPNQLPSRRGFERTVALADSGADNWEQKPYLPIYDKANWYADGEELRLPEDFYSSRFLVDKAIEFIDSNRGDGQPFFAYIPFQAVHIPVQAPQEFIDRYRGVYDSGWETLRQERLTRAVELGIVPPGSTAVTMSTTADWDALSAEHKAFHAKSMAVYAAMVEAMDFHIGRLVDYLEQTGQYDNTLFVFTSDNGAEASGLADPTAWWNRLLAAQNGYSVDYETLGLRGSFNALSPSFASAAASPLAFYKFYVGEGGMRVPLIIAGEMLPKKGRRSSAFTWVTDLAATILEVAGVPAPQERYAGRPVEQITGRSLSPVLSGKAERIYFEDDPVGYELSGHSVLFQGDYKLVRNRPPVGDGQWHLYNIVTDPGESRDLRDVMPDRFEQMAASYDAFAEANHVLPVPDGYNYLIQGTLNGLHDRFGPQLLVMLLTLLVLLPFYLWHRSRNDRASPD
jgi:arylsulfatase/uncharacterized sulfatase